MNIDLIDQINNWGKNSFLKYGLIETIINIGLILILAFIVSKLLKKFIHRHYKGNKLFILRLKNILVYSFAIYGCLNQFLPFSDITKILAASTGIVTLALGLAAQDAVGNFVNGMMIAMFKPFKTGDLIRIDSENIIGTVVDISLRHTIIQTYENTRVIIPNSTMNKAILENISTTNNRKANFLELDISYESDVDKAMDIIKEEILRHPNFLDVRTQEEKNNHIPPVITRITGFLDSSVHLKTTIYSKNNAEGFAMLCDLRYAIKKRFDKEGIEFPYPHRTITYKEEVTKSDAE